MGGGGGGEEGNGDGNGDDRTDDGNGDDRTDDDNGDDSGDDVVVSALLRLHVRGGADLTDCMRDSLNKAGWGAVLNWTICTQSWALVGVMHASYRKGGSITILDPAGTRRA